MTETAPAARFGFRDGEGIQSWDRVAVAIRRNPFIQRTWQKNLMLWSLMIELFDFVSDFGLWISDFCCRELTCAVRPNYFLIYTGAGPEGTRLCCCHAV
jgi:hypothetical protein